MKYIKSASAFLFNSALLYILALFIAMLVILAIPLIALNRAVESVEEEYK